MASDQVAVLGMAISIRPPDVSKTPGAISRCPGFWSMPVVTWSQFNGLSMRVWFSLRGGYVCMGSRTPVVRKLSSCVTSEKKLTDQGLWSNRCLSGSKLNRTTDSTGGFPKITWLESSDWPRRVPAAPARVKLSCCDNLFLKEQALALSLSQTNRFFVLTFPRKRLSYRPFGPQLILQDV